MCSNIERVCERCKIQAQITMWKKLRVACKVCKTGLKELLYHTTISKIYLILNFCKALFTRDILTHNIAIKRLKDNFLSKYLVTFQNHIK